MRASISCLRYGRAALLLLLFMATATYAQITPLGDSYVNTAAATTNYGAKPLLDVESASQTTYIQFDLSSIPAGYTSSNIAKASLKIYVNAVTTAGSLNVDYVNGTWAESTITASNAPALGTTIAASVPLAKSNVHDYILIDITPAVEAWLNGTEPNDGIALVGNSPLNASFDSKESTTQSHPPELDIVFAGGGTITGVTTASGSGLIGGGTGGTLNLSLTNACANNQVLQWNSASWVCAAVGTGTITGVTAGTDLAGGGTSGNVTLYLDTTKVPQLNYANTFTGNQTVNGNLSATGVVTGSSYQIGSSLFAYGSASLGDAFLGFAGNGTNASGGNTATGVGALSNTTGNNNTATGNNALFSNGTGYSNTASGAGALSSNTTGYGNTASGHLALHYNTTGSYNTANGYQALYNVNGLFSTGSNNTASGAQALASNTTGNNNTASGLAALYSNTTGYYNTASGYQALYSNQTGYQDTAEGYQALFYNTGVENTASGYQALYSNTSGAGNTAVGDLAMISNTTGDNNTAIGITALSQNQTGGENTALGMGALSRNTTGDINTAVGESALVGVTSGSGNTAVGPQAGNVADGSNLTGSYNIFLGLNAGPSTGSISNSVAIGLAARVGQNNAVILGGTGQYAVKVGVGTPTPTNIFTIGQGSGHAIADGWDTYSSRRWKTNIHTLHDALGKVEQLRGVSYDLKANGQHELGVIAEEVGAVVPEVVTWEKNGEDARSVDYGRLTALLIEATKEQQALIQKQQEQIRAQQEQIVRLTRQVKTIQATLNADLRGDSPIRTVKVKAEGTKVRQ